jgi:hypothetical protein
MTTAESRPLVRPQFAKWSALVLAVLLPILAYTIWDFVEMRRFRSRIDAIAARGEPITTQGPFRISGDAADAERFYRAAGTLAHGFRSDAPRSILGAFDRDVDWRPETVDAVRVTLAKYGESLALADRASDLPFAGFRANTTFGYLIASFSEVSALCDLRARLAVLDGRPDDAIASLYTQARMRRAASTFLSFNQFTLSSVVERTHPSTASLERLGKALADLDRDDDYLKTDFIRLRAQAVDSSQMPLSSGLFVIRNTASPPPWEVHRYTRALDTFAAIIAGAERPEPARVSGVLAVGRFPEVLAQSKQERSRDNLEAFVHGRVRSVVFIRASHALVAIERFRRDHVERLPGDLQELVPAYIDRLPLDPYTGQAMRYRALEGGYTVYSVGPNGRDDGGEMTPAEMRDLSRRDPEYRKTRDDVGIRVRQSPSR